MRTLDDVQRDVIEMNAGTARHTDGISRCKKRLQTWPLSTLPHFGFS
jgi:hypothetical protein